MGNYSVTDCFWFAHFFFLSLIVIINIIFAWTHVGFFFDNLIASTGLLQQQRREPCAGHTLASVSLCRLTSLSVGSRRVTEGGSHHNHCRGCELAGETQTSAVVFFLRKLDWCWQVCEGWGNRSSWFTAWRLLHATAFYFKAAQHSVQHTHLCGI